MFCCAGQKSEASHSVKPSLVSMLNAKILYFWLEKDCASHSPQMIEPAALERESRRSQQTSMILSSALCKNRSMIYCHSFTTHFLWGHFFFFFFKPQQRRVSVPLSSTGIYWRDRQSDSSNQGYLPSVSLSAYSQLTSQLIIPFSFIHSPGQKDPI